MGRFSELGTDDFQYLAFTKILTTHPLTIQNGSPGIRIESMMHDGKQGLKSMMHDGKQKPQDWHLLPGCRRGRGMACFCGPLYAVTLSLSVRAPGPDGCRPRAVHFASTRSRLSRKGQKAGNVEAVVLLVACCSCSFLRPCCFSR
jgi:hypothetical protein